MTHLIARKRVLIAEDETGLRTLMRDTIAGDYEVLEAATGQQALRVAETYRLDAILLDIGMSETDGLTVCRLLKSFPDMASVRVIMTSGRADGQRGRSSFDVGADYFLPKPFTPQALRQLLQIACSN
ncbi:MAG: response regulator [Candidatus Sericytochromatia bacterium]|nr:response regulator [Candidatus Sericytochromatia bacterium]